MYEACNNPPGANDLRFQRNTTFSQSSFFTQSRTSLSSLFSSSSFDVRSTIHTAASWEAVIESLGAMVCFVFAAA